MYAQVVILLCVKTLSWGGSCGCTDVNPCLSQSHAVARLPYLHDADSRPISCYPWTYPLKPTQICGTWRRKRGHRHIRISLVWFSTFFLTLTGVMLTRDTVQQILTGSHSHRVMLTRCTVYLHWHPPTGPCWPTLHTHILYILLPTSLTSLNTSIFILKRRQTLQQTTS
jgi:hypothetical protein